MSVAEWLILTITALLAAVLSGVLGMGGGVALLGVMTAILPAPVVVPLHGVIQLVSNCTRTLALLRHVVWRVVAVFAPPLVLGLAFATALWSGNKLNYLRPVVGVLLLAFVALRRRAPKLRNLPTWTYAPLGLVTGFASVWIGAVGPLLAPFFLRDDLEPEQIIATKAACQSISHLLKIPAFVVLGFEFVGHGELLLTLVVVVIVGTLIGRAILTRIERARFVTAFEILLVTLAIWLITAPLIPTS